LLLALRIQTHHATFGARDQWGMGAMWGVTLPDITLAPVPIPTAATGLFTTLFARLTFNAPAPDSWHDKLQIGLGWRAHLRGTFRQSPQEEALRHYLFGSPVGGHAKKYGSAFNVSAPYPDPQDRGRSHIRIWACLPHTRGDDQAQSMGEEYAEIVKRIRTTIGQGLANAPHRHFARPVSLDWQDGAEQRTHPAAWIAKLAGVTLP
ncbi:MAG: hypothetical protein WCP34_15105, partial [Pseudomonadota bacterium]